MYRALRSITFELFGGTQVDDGDIGFGGVRRHDPSRARAGEGGFVSMPVSVASAGKNGSARSAVAVLLDDAFDEVRCGESFDDWYQLDAAPLLAQVKTVR